MKAHEVVTMKFRRDATPESIGQSLEQSTSFLRTCSGFLSRQVLHEPAQDVWIDQVVWADMDSAVEAAAKFESAPEVAQFVTLLDPAKMRMWHPVSFFNSGDSQRAR